MPLPVVNATSVGTNAPNQYYPKQDAPSTTALEPQPPRPGNSLANTIKRTTNSSGSDPPNYAAPIIHHYRTQQQPNHPLSSGALNPPSTTKSASHGLSGRPNTTETASQVVSSGRQMMPSPVLLKIPYQQSSPRSAIHPGVSREETSSAGANASNQPYYAAPVHQYSRKQQQNPVLLSASSGALKPPPATTSKTTAPHVGSARQMPVKNPYQQSSPGRAIHPGVVVSGATTQMLVSSQPFTVPNPKQKHRRQMNRSAASKTSKVPKIMFGGNVSLLVWRGIRG
jgi:hypothetical protein